MKYLIIRNEGVMALEAITLIGASTKRGNERTIGQYGSGLNYSIANLLKQKVPFGIYLGSSKIEITTKEVDLRGQKFNRIIINGTETSFTDTMGMEDWAGMFPLIREIYSNALDEDDNAVCETVTADSLEEAVNPFLYEGYTTYAIELNQDGKNVMLNFNNYFSKDIGTLYKSSTGRILPPFDHIRIFRRGIVAYNNSYEKSLFSYDLQHVEINESRVLRNVYDANRTIGAILEAMTDSRLISRWVLGLANANTGIYEHKCILGEYEPAAGSPELHAFISANKFCPVEMFAYMDEDDRKGRIVIPMALIKRFLKYVPDADVKGLDAMEEKVPEKKIKDPSPRLFDKVTDAMSILRLTPYKDRLNLKVLFAEFKTPTTLAETVRDTVYLSTKLELYSEQEIASLIIEEQEKIHTGYYKEGSSLKNHFIRLYTNSLFTQKRDEDTI
jgi:hypothetical protein